MPGPTEPIEKQAQRSAGPSISGRREMDDDLNNKSPDELKAIVENLTDQNTNLKKDKTQLEEQVKLLAEIEKLQRENADLQRQKAELLGRARVPVQIPEATSSLSELTEERSEEEEEEHVSAIFDASLAQIPGSHQKVEKTEHQS
jgi:hypothetical protein